MRLSERHLRPVAAMVLALGLPAPSLDAQLITQTGVAQVSAISDIVSPGDVHYPQGDAQVRGLTREEKAAWYLRHTFGPGALQLPVLPAALIVANPPKAYPHEWRAGVAGFGRNFADSLATETGANVARFAIGTLNHEDPRYFPDRSRNPAHRTLHAILFTVVDRSDDGHRKLALSNFAGSLAAGFVGRAYLPDGYNDNVHALQRAGGAMGGFQLPTMLVGYTTGNLFSEYSPELRRLGRKLHVPLFHKQSADRSKGGSL